MCILLIILGAVIVVASTPNIVYVTSNNESSSGLEADSHLSRLPLDFYSDSVLASSRKFCSEVHHLSNSNHSNSYSIDFASCVHDTMRIIRHLRIRHNSENLRSFKTDYENDHEIGALTYAFEMLPIITQNRKEVSACLFGHIMPPISNIYLLLQHLNYTLANRVDVYMFFSETDNMDHTQYQRYVENMQALYTQLFDNFPPHFKQYPLRGNHLKTLELLIAQKRSSLCDIVLVADSAPNSRSFTISELPKLLTRLKEQHYGFRAGYSNSNINIEKSDINMNSFLRKCDTSRNCAQIVVIARCFDLHSVCLDEDIVYSSDVYDQPDPFRVNTSQLARKPFLPERMRGLNDEYFAVELTAIVPAVSFFGYYGGDEIFLENFEIHSVLGPDDANYKVFTYLEVGFPKRPMDPMSISRQMKKTTKVTPDVPLKKSDLIIYVTFGYNFFASNARGLVRALRRLGFPNVVLLPDTSIELLMDTSLLPTETVNESVTRSLQRLQIVLGPNSQNTMLLNNYVVFQFEQRWSEFFTNRLYLHYYTILSGALAILDFSFSNLEFLEELGFKDNNIFVLPVYHDMADSEVEDRSDGVDFIMDASDSVYREENPKSIDLLFFGSISERRTRILDFIQLQTEIDGSRLVLRFIRCVRIAECVFGASLDNLVRSSKVVMILHLHDQSALEVHRVNYLLSLGACVVAERSKVDSLLDKHYDDAGAIVFPRSSDDFYSVVKLLLAYPSLRQEVRRKGKQFYREMAMDNTQLDRAMTHVLSNLSP